jgi:hypothetical protein
MGQPRGQIVASHRTRTTAVGIIVGLALHSLALVQGVLSAWAQAGQAASEPQLKAGDHIVLTFLWQEGWEGQDFQVGIAVSQTQKAK